MIDSFSNLLELIEIQLPTTITPIKSHINYLKLANMFEILYTNSVFYQVWEIICMIWLYMVMGCNTRNLYAKNKGQNVTIDTYIGLIWRLTLYEGPKTWIAFYTGRWVFKLMLPTGHCTNDAIKRGERRDGEREAEERE